MRKHKYSDISENNGHVAGRSDHGRADFGGGADYGGADFGGGIGHGQADFEGGPAAYHEDDRHSDFVGNDHAEFVEDDHVEDVRLHAVSS